jgi:hypothetical protein
MQQPQAYCSLRGTRHVRRGFDCLEVPGCCFCTLQQHVICRPAARRVFAGRWRHGQRQYTTTLWVLLKQQPCGRFELQVALSSCLLQGGSQLPLCREYQLPPAQQACHQVVAVLYGCGML